LEKKDEQLNESGERMKKETTSMREFGSMITSEV
jgi:hypothetical protein